MLRGLLDEWAARRQLLQALGADPDFLRAQLDPDGSPVGGGGDRAARVATLVAATG